MPSKQTTAPNPISQMRPSRIALPRIMPSLTQGPGTMPRNRRGVDNSAETALPASIRAAEGVWRSEPDGTRSDAPKPCSSWMRSLCIRGSSNGRANSCIGEEREDRDDQIHDQKVEEEEEEVAKLGVEAS